MTDLRTEHRRAERPDSGHGECTLTIRALPGLPTVRQGDALPVLICDALRGAEIVLRDGDILVVAQKIVSKSEGRRVRLADVMPSARARALAEQTGKDARVVELILGEATEIVRTRPGLIIVRNRAGLVLANAGIDASNVDSGAGEDSVLLLPEDSDQSAAAIRGGLHALSGVAPGVVINDSIGRAWRAGTIGTAIGVAGLTALRDLRGRRDRTGRTLTASDLGVADEVAAAASLAMGQADEGRPVVHLRGFPYPLGGGDSRALIRPAAQDLFR